MRAGTWIACLLLLAVAASAGPALSIDDILSLKELGYSDDAIAAEIRRTGTRLDLEPADRKRLADAGIGEKVLHLLAGKAPPANPLAKPAEPVNPLAKPPAPENPLAKPPAAENPLAKPPAPENPLARPPGEKGVPDLMTSAKAVYTGPAALVLNAMTWSRVAVEAAFYASRQTGGARLVTTGTLTQTAPGTLNFRYTASPGDRLHVVMADGTTADYSISTMQGALRGGAENFLSSDHSLAVRIVIPDTLDLTLTSTRKRPSDTSYDGTQTASLKGAFLLEKKPAKVDLTAKGTFYFESSLGGMEHRSKMKYTGTLHVGGVAYNLLETWDQNTVSAMVKRHGVTATRTVASTVRTVGSTWKLGVRTCAFEDLVVLSAFNDGVPATTDERYWKAHGHLTVDGRPVAQASITKDSSHLRLVLTGADGATELERWHLRRIR